MERPKVVSVMASGMYSSVMTEEAEDKLYSFAALVKNEKEAVSSEEEMMDLLHDAHGCITGWGVKLSEAVVRNAGQLKIIGHAAGSVKSIIPTLAYDRGIVVTHAAGTIAPSVGEMALGFAIAGLRNFTEHDTAFKRDGTRGDQTIPRLVGDRGLHCSRVGIIGASMTGREFIKLLKAFGDVEIWVYDPYLPERGAEELRVQKAPLDKLLSECDVISLHAPATEETHHMIGKEQVRLIKDGALLINTARGWLINHDALLEELKTGRFKAALDVYLETISKSDVPTSEYRKLKNVIITPGIAGPAAQILRQLGGTIVDEFERFFSGKKLKYQVTKDMLPTMA